MLLTVALNHLRNLQMQLYQSSSLTYSNLTLPLLPRVAWYGPLALLPPPLPPPPPRRDLARRRPL